MNPPCEAGFWFEPAASASSLKPAHVHHLPAQLSQPPVQRLQVPASPWRHIDHHNPGPAWARTTSNTAAIVALLRRHVQFIDFSYHGEKGDYKVDPSRFAHIATMIVDRRIHVAYTTTRKPLYFPFAAIPPGSKSRHMVKAHTMLLPDRSVKSRRLRAQVVHESCHAMSDSDARKNALRLDEEVVGFVAHLMFLVHHGLPQKPGLPAAAKAVDTAARDIATLLLQKKAPTSVQWQHLRDAIRAHPDYRNKVDEIITFGGIPRN